MVLACACRRSRLVRLAMIRGLKTRTMRTDGLRMGYHPRLSDPARELVSRIQLLGSPRALQEMSDPELERWMQTCQAMLAAPPEQAAPTAHGASCSTTPAASTPPVENSEAQTAAPGRRVF